MNLFGNREQGGRPRDPKIKESQCKRIERIWVPWLYVDKAVQCNLRDRRVILIPGC